MSDRSLLHPRDFRSRSPGEGVGWAFDWVQPLLILALAVTGVFFIYSAQAFTGGGLWQRQIFWIVVGLVVYTVVAFTPTTFFNENAVWIWLGSLGLLALVPIIGVEGGGAKRWLDLRFFLFQPAEIAKIGVLVMAASILSRSRLGSVRESAIPLVLVAFFAGLPWLLIFIQPDLGTSLVIPVMILTVLYVSRLSIRFFVATLVAMTLGLGVIALDIQGYYNHFKERDLSFLNDMGDYEPHGLLPIRDYQRNRILGLVAPQAVDPSGVGMTWNLRQSLISVGSGGLWGKGWTEGTQARLGYLPRSVAHTDFIFSVIAEETGFLGGLGVLLLYGLLIGNGLRIGALAVDRFGRLLAVGVSALFVVHLGINVGMTIGLMPITGLPLPFLSYGGSFFISCCILQGFLQGVYRQGVKPSL